jgi:hypothetical protein
MVESVAWFGGGNNSAGRSPACAPSAMTAAHAIASPGEFWFALKSGITSALPLGDLTR